jgi:excisionase family DNA binding protein
MVYYVKENEAKQVYLVDEAAPLLRVGRSALYEAIGRGEFRAVKIGRRIIIPRIVLAEMLGENFDAVDGASIEPSTENRS